MVSKPRARFLKALARKRRASASKPRATPSSKQQGGPQDAGPKPCYFLDLPPELRLDIYSHVLEDFDPNTIEQASLANILLTNKLIREEATKPFWDRCQMLWKEYLDRSKAAEAAMKEVQKAGIPYPLEYTFIHRFRYDYAAHAGVQRWFLARLKTMYVDNFLVPEWQNAMHEARKPYLYEFYMKTMLARSKAQIESDRKREEAGEVIKREEKWCRNRLL